MDIKYRNVDKQDLLILIKEYDCYESPYLLILNLNLVIFYWKKNKIPLSLTSHLAKHIRQKSAESFYI